MFYKEEILKRIEQIVSKPGFIYTLAILLRKDLFLDPSETADINWKDKISFQEFTLLIGLMVKHKIELVFPTEKEIGADIEEIYKLFEELHASYMEHFISRINEDIKDKKSDDSSEEQDFKKLFGTGEMMSEPMFYGGSGAYDFQFTEMAIKKYSHDAVWINKNKNFSMNQVIKVIDDLRIIINNKANSKYIPTSFEDFCENILDVFCFSIKDLSYTDDKEVAAILNAFSVEAGTVNKEFNSVGQYNIITSHPIIKLKEDKYFLPIRFNLTQSVYESPFYWMYQDKDYKDNAAKNRGISTEDIAFEILEPVFSDGIFRDIKVLRSKSETSTDIDILAIAGNKAIVFQAKSKRLTELSRQGNTEKLKNDFTEAVQKAYEQGLICRDAILNRANKLVDINSKEIKLSESIDEVYIVCLTSDDYPALTNQVDTYLIKKRENPFPIAMSVFDLDIVAYYLNDPFEFLYYIRQRIDLSGYFKGSNEMAFLGFHLNKKLFKFPNNDMVGIDDSFAQLIDANFQFYRGYHPKTKVIERLHHNWKNKKFEKLIEQIKNTNEPGFTDAIFYLYDIAGDGADRLIDTIDKTIQKTKQDGNNHDFSLIFDNGKSGITFVSQAGKPETLGKKLMNLAIARKYKTKADIWLALGSIVGDDRMVSALGFTKEPWEYDQTLEEFSKKYLKQGTPMSMSGNKIGRNDPCPCGKLKPDGNPMKYKNCCGK